MLRLLKSIFLISFVFCLTCVFAEEITITTYYPSPYGSYGFLQTDKLGVGDNDASGALTSADVPTTSGNVWIKGNVGIGTITPGVKLDVVGTIEATALGKSNCAWTDWFRTENSNSPQYAPDGAYIAGIDYTSTTGGDDGVIRFYYCFPGN